MYSQSSSTFTAGLCTATQIACLCGHKNPHTPALEEKPQHCTKPPTLNFAGRVDKEKEKDNTQAVQGCVPHLHKLASLNTSSLPVTGRCSFDSSFQVTALPSKLVYEGLDLRQERSMLSQYRTSCMLHSSPVEGEPK